MEVNLTLTAAEVLNEIVLHHLQNENLASAEKTEQSFYEAFENLSSGAIKNAEPFFVTEIEADIDLFKSAAGDIYEFIYAVASNSITILNIFHTSRLNKTTT